MPASQVCSDFNTFAWAYNKYWGPMFMRPAMSLIEKRLEPHLSRGARILDVCCGTGHIAARLIERGYQVTGLDGSEEMLAYARQNAPAGEFVLGDARSFTMPERFDAVISTYNSLNYMESLESLQAALSNVHAALDEGGIFLFDLNMEDVYADAFPGYFTLVGDDHACIERAHYDEERGLGRDFFTIFRLIDGTWQRFDFSFPEKYYSHEEIHASLSEAGFVDIDKHRVTDQPQFSKLYEKVIYTSRAARH